MVEGRVLIVEDEHIVAMGIKRMLITLGYTVAGIASSGEGAIKKAESTIPDLVLMDIMLKGDVNGIEAAKEIKSLFDIPVVYLTACSEHKIVEKAWETNPSGYIVKPFDERDLQKRIYMALRRYKMEEQSIKKDPERAEKDLSKVEKDPDKIRNLPVTKISQKVSE
jgi:DNA-binding NarL/FixJ family response regulator